MVSKAADVMFQELCRFPPERSSNYSMMVFFGSFFCNSLDAVSPVKCCQVKSFCSELSVLSATTKASPSGEHHDVRAAAVSSMLLCSIVFRYFLPAAKSETLLG